jgi:hypothetical protein
MKNAIGLALALSLLAVPQLARAETPEEVGEQIMTAMEKMATIVDNDKASCDTMAKDISDFADQNAPLFAKGKELEAKATPEQKKAWKEKYAKRAQALGEKMRPGMMACAKNEKVKTALGKMKMK